MQQVWLPANIYSGQNGMLSALILMILWLYRILGIEARHGMCAGFFFDKSVQEIPQPC
jgi:hypothetical protein